ncbi:MAG: ImmA/IrrE family metallo-endopeptidase [Abditibacteriota bacterium]|nr:ImmA/IrrE family metallo-endopeptidase [Abditibacteriota bacterium]MBP5093601.1 ImmA/IrrE family metallo-endopeptidase [Abditibacteriota bacterium]MBP5719289.1 ImmA/IrrE family metallo-endopeptidase [Abditibacteriota bacterium]
MARKGDALLALSLVTEIRERYNLSCPVNLEDLAEKLGIDVYFRPFSEEIDGFYLTLPGMKPVIAVNNIPSKSPRRRRFTLAHEIGHHMLAGRTSGALLIGYDTRNAKDTATERTCDLFASALLMPEDEVRRRFNGSAASVADYFEVSEAVAESRLLELKLIKRQSIGFRRNK